MGYGASSINIPITTSDPDGGPVSLQILGLPSGLEQVGNNIVGTVHPGALDTTFSLNFVATDNEGNVTTVTAPLETVQYQLSDLFGTILVSEVLYHPTALNDQFIEISSILGTPIDISGLRITNGNPLFEGPSLDFSVPTGTRIDVVHGRERALLWSHKPAIMFPPWLIQGWALEQFSLLDVSSDDIFLFDADGALVAYVAWGTGPSSLHPPTAHNQVVWDDSVQEQLGGSGQGRSISRTSTAAGSLTLSDCWEHTATGTSQAAGNCPGASLTIDADLFQPQRVTNVAWWEWD